MAPTTKEIDPLDHLEERIQKAVLLVNRLRDEKEALTKAAAADKLQAQAEKDDITLAAAIEKEADDKIRDQLRVDLEEAKNSNLRLTSEMEALREERLQVRSRLEKLLGHIDQLGTA